MSEARDKGVTLGLAGLLNQKNIAKDVDAAAISRELENKYINSDKSTVAPVEGFRRELAGLGLKSDNNGSVVDPFDDLDDLETLAQEEDPGLGLLGLDTNDGGDWLDEDDELKNMTNEQAKKRKVREVTEDIGDDSHLDQFEEEERKLELLDEIDQLKEKLINDGANISRIGDVSVKDNYETIDRVYRMLKLKANRTEYAELGRSGIVSVSKIIGKIFNGERQMFGIRPNLKGWHATVDNKLTRKKYEAANMTNTIIKTFNLPKWMVTVFDIVLSAFIYASTHSNQHQQFGLNLNEEYTKAANDISNLE